MLGPFPDGTSASHNFKPVTVRTKMHERTPLNPSIRSLSSSSVSSLYIRASLLSLSAPDGAADQEMKDGLAVIAVSEDSKTLDSFLRFCYPSTLAEDPSLENLTDVLSVLAAAKKYSLDLIERKSPFAAFAIARNARLKDETIIAAKHSLRQPLIPAWFGEIDLITASDFLALLTYHKNCTIAVHALMKDLQWIKYHYGAVAADGGTDNRLFLWNNAPVAWWITYMQEVFELLMDRPTGDTVRIAADKTVQNVRSANCGGCSAQVKTNMADFSELLALKVEEAVAPIELEMDF
ncbi:uncharacterized protein EDB91DRAFT_1084226 [Suillus paluster]|uniref:uncharacterized protein n=1 Tax=Suillus paluster TaxID=48578 RepID=UPI001B869136|nr:uncharacterized protein EDB91DRAFT_1084226 [Suillus paluster]KAG1734088.1 hypothetical protein EDB91DRAFT_1084226 [Suillus paluster]